MIITIGATAGLFLSWVGVNFATDLFHSRAGSLGSSGLELKFPKLGSKVTFSEKVDKSLAAETTAIIWVPDCTECSIRHLDVEKLRTYRSKGRTLVAVSKPGMKEHYPKAIQNLFQAWYCNSEVNVGGSTEFDACMALMNKNSTISNVFEVMK